MAWNNVRNEPKREWIEQAFGGVVIIAYIVWGFICVHLSLWVYPLEKCGEFFSDGSCYRRFHTDYWTDPGNATLWLIWMIAPWLLYPSWLFIHVMGEFACGILTSMGWDPRPNPRENTRIRVGGY